MRTDHDKGEVLWIASDAKPGGAWIYVLFSMLMLALGGLFLWATIVAYSDNPSHPAFWVGLGGSGVFILFGIYLIYSAFFKTKLYGIRFFQRGVELEFTREQKFIRYAELEIFEFTPDDMAQQDSDKKWAVGRLVVSAAAMSATGVGNAVGTMLMPRTAGTLYFKPKDWSKMQLTIWQRDAERLAPLLNMAKRR